MPKLSAEAKAQRDAEIKALRGQRDALIDYFMPLSKGIAKGDDDLCSELVVAIILAIDGCPPEVDLLAQVYINIRRARSDYYDRAQTVRIPRSQRRVIKKRTGEDPIHLPKPRVSGDLNIDEEVEDLCQTETEAEIFRLRLQGFSDAEISEKLDISRTMVWQVRKRLQARYQKAA